MKDNEIIKALECCVHIGENENCNKCKYNQEYLHGSSLLMNALDLINRQKAEIERLQKEKFDSLNSQFAEMYATTLKIATKKAKSEARKEFAERLKEEIRLSTGNNGGFVPSMIDNLLKEMEGEENEK